MTTVEAVKGILGDALNLGERTAALRADSRLFGEMPEFDSMAVVTVLTMIEEEFAVEIHDDEISADVFQTVGTLSEFVEAKVQE